ncbi:MAG: lamin tail domain-containing protein [Phycisphaerales bacterium]|nr:lamin tail domain-containing protein [Phycisphaerales bacterium]
MKQCCRIGLATWVALALVSAASANIVISQVYGGGGNAGATYKNDFVELFNAGASAVSVDGWSVQYASSAGSTWAITPLAGTIQPGQYYLVQQAQGTGGTVDLPTPDAVGTIAMAAANGKVALVTTTVALTGTCPWPSATIADFVGFGTANCFEGAGATPALTNTLAALRLLNGCQDTDSNATDFETGAPNPRNTASPLNLCGAPVTGACCNGITCTLATEADCTGSGGSYLGDGTNCTLEPCVPLFGGACCNGTNCTIATELDCVLGGGLYQGTGTNCDGNPCGAADGACCLSGIICEIRTEADCLSASGVYQGNGTSCDPYPCITACTTIAEARALPIGSAVRICNAIVTSDFDQTASVNSSSMWIQDDTSAANVFGDTSNIAELLAASGVGHRIDIVGLTNEFNGLFELDGRLLAGSLKVVVDHGFVGVPAPIVITAGELMDGSATAESYESRIVTIECVTFTSAGNFASGVNYPVTDATGEAIARISRPDQDLVGTAIPTEAVTVTGIVSQFSASGVGGYQLLLRSLADIDTEDDCGPPTGACCFGATCEIGYNDTTCATAGGIFVGEGTSCANNPCVGACCVAGACTVTTPADCAGDYLGGGTSCLDQVCPLPVTRGDIALGLNFSNALTTLEHIRDGARIARWPSQRFVQSVAFDSTDGIRQNGQGNLLALNFGTTAGGGQLYSYATNGSNASQVLYNWDGMEGALTRIAGLSVSPNNQYIATWGYDTTAVHVLAYHAGTPGTGSGAAITNAWTHSATFANAGLTQGTAWLNDSTILTLTTQFIPGLVTLSTVDFDTVNGTFNQVERVDVLVPVTAGSQVMSLAYNPSIAPFVFGVHSTFTGGVRYNTLMVFDPSNWTLLRQLSLANSLDTAREIALGPDGLLYLSQFGGDIDTLVLDVDGNSVINASDIAALTDDSSVDYYNGPTASFLGLDVAHGAEIVEPTTCPGDANGDTLVNFADISPFIAAIKAGSAANWTCNLAGGFGPYLNSDANGDGVVNFADISPFIALLKAPPAPCVSTCP